VGDKEQGDIYSPVATHNDHQEEKDINDKVATTAILEGLGASPGIAYGEAKLVSDASELGKVKDGDILVAVMTTPDMVPAMKRAAGIVTDEAG